MDYDLPPSKTRYRRSENLLSASAGNAQTRTKSFENSAKIEVAPNAEVIHPEWHENMDFILIKITSLKRILRLGSTVQTRKFDPTRPFAQYLCRFCTKYNGPVGCFKFTGTMVGSF